MNKIINKYLRILRLIIKHYHHLFLWKEHAIKKCKEDFKRVKGLPGFLYKFFLGLILKFFLFFVLLGGYKSGIEFNSFSNLCSLWFFPELLIFDIDKFRNLEIYKIIPICFLIISANMIFIIEKVEQLKKFISNKK